MTVSRSKCNTLLRCRHELTRPPLCAEERACIMQMSQQRLSLRHIAAVYSISREIRGHTIAVVRCGRHWFSPTC